LIKHEITKGPYAVLILPEGWKDYALLDMANGEKLERWGDVVAARPDPQIIWPKTDDRVKWDCHLRYHRSNQGGGSWERIKKTPDRWTVTWRSLKFLIRPTDFKHMGLFPEQAANWDWIMRNAGPNLKILNLFGYTGGASVAAAKTGANVTHVDAAKGMNMWAKENAGLNGLDNIRFITDDVMKFVLREQRRGSRYDAVIMDPPSYGRGPGGEVWKIEDRLYELTRSCVQLLSADAKFFLINSYTTGFSPVVPENILRVTLKKGVTSGELGIKCDNGLILPCGIYARWERAGK
jgi:23S rRNA (cytosine1962-C5)-methyltransferase